jgi:hypothetical protein
MDDQRASMKQASTQENQVWTAIHV